MTDEMWGANLGTLDQFSVELERSNQTLTDLWRVVRVRLQAAPWEGPNADQFRALWEGPYRRQLEAAAAAFRTGSQVIARNAAAQRQTSAADGGGRNGHGAGDATGAAALSTLLGTVASRRWFYNQLSAWENGKRIPPRVLASLPGLQWAVDEGHELAAEMRTRPPAEQADWWASLSSDQQQAMLIAYPGLVLGLSGLPTSTLASARDQFIDAESSDVVDRVSRDTYKVELGVGVVNLSAEASATIATMADGQTTRITLNLSGELGRDFGGASVGGGAGMTAVYEFGNPEAAAQFMADLRASLGPGGTSPLDVLGSPALTSRSVNLEAQGKLEVDIGGQSVSLSGAAGGELDLDTGERTLYVELDASADTAIGNAALGGRVELIYDSHNNLTGAVISGQATVSSSAEASAFIQDLSGQTVPLGAAENSGGMEVGFRAEIDPSDPGVQADLAALARNPGDTAALGRLFAGADASIQVSTTQSNSASTGGTIGGVGLKGTSTHSSSDAVLSFRRPSYGPWVEIPV